MARKLHIRYPREMHHIVLSRERVGTIFGGDENRPAMLRRKGQDRLSSLL